MKQYFFDIGLWQADELFAPIRNKRDTIRILMKTLKIMLANENVNADKLAGEIVLVVSKMSRLFYFSEYKYFSINFPFTVTESDRGLIYSSKNIEDVDSWITSQILSIITAEHSFESCSIYDFIDPIASVTEYHASFWAFFKDLLLYEDGYIRYDYDEKNQDDSLHPLNHYDVFYSPGATFKIGLRSRIHREVIIDLLRLESKCHFFE